MLLPHTRIIVSESDNQQDSSAIQVRLDKEIRFSTDSLRSYAFAGWEPLLYDAMVVAAAIECADRSVKRSQLGWTRRLDVSIPVHAPEKWSAPQVSAALHEALGFLTGDIWSIEFQARQRAAAQPLQNPLSLSSPAEAVIPFSDGMDSRALAGILGQTLGESLLRLRVGTGAGNLFRQNGQVVPFAGVPYSIRVPVSHKESSARSRGFKFLLVGGIAGYLVDAKYVAIPESGQGSIGPALVTTNHSYPDYRNHPAFGHRMTAFLAALLGREIRYEFPRLWHTKGETLKEYAALECGADWPQTKTCWRGSQWCSADGKLRQCGLCASCLLRRMSVFAAGLGEDSQMYLASDLASPTFEGSFIGVTPKGQRAFREYGIAGVQSLDHLAELSRGGFDHAIGDHALLLSESLRGQDPDECEQRLTALLRRHAAEWSEFLQSLGSRSFLRRWATE